MRGVRWGARGVGCEGWAGDDGWSRGEGRRGGRTEHEAALDQGDLHRVSTRHVGQLLALGAVGLAEVARHVREDLVARLRRLLVNG